MTPRDLVGRLSAILPGFRAELESEDNLFRDDDGTLTHCGVFACASLDT